jgi:hypothetical protein
MKAFIHHHLFTQTSLDSGSLTMLGAVIHNFSEPGKYQGRVLRGTQTTASFRLTVNQDCPAMQVNIDLATLALPAPEHVEDELGCREPGRHFAVNPKGHVVFYVSQGAGGFTVRVGRVDEGHVATAFDSSELKEGDLFAVTMVRPGTYSVTNINTGAKGEIVVTSPRVGKVPYRPPQPVEIECLNDEFKPDNIRIEPAQGQVYRFKTQSRIKVGLVKPDNGPKGASQQRIAEWRK